MIYTTKKAHVGALVGVFCVLLTVFTLRLSVSAAETGAPGYTMEEIEACLEEYGEEYYAYMILDEAEESLKPIILEARWRIISNSDWVDDELNGHIEDEAGNIIETVPHFHEVFPADWEIETGRDLY